jgi:hypothetical protein
MGTIRVIDHRVIECLEPDRENKHDRIKNRRWIIHVSGLDRPRTILALYKTLKPTTFHLCLQFRHSGPPGASLGSEAPHSPFLFFAGLKTAGASADPPDFLLVAIQVVIAAKLTRAGTRWLEAAILACSTKPTYGSSLVALGHSTPTTNAGHGNLWLERHYFEGLVFLRDRNDRLPFGFVLFAWLT